MAHLRDLDEALELMHFGRRNDGLTVGDLVRILGVTKQALHRPLADLVARSLVVREIDAKNRRFVRLRLARAGAAFERKLSGTQRRRLRARLRPRGRAERARLVRCDARAPRSRVLWTTLDGL